jgi:D-alanine-D-alanine ligase
MTDHSLVPMAARAVGLSYEDLCLEILKGAHVG